MTDYNWRKNDDNRDYDDNLCNSERHDETDDEIMYYGSQMLKSEYDSYHHHPVTTISRKKYDCDSDSISSACSSTTTTTSEQYNRKQALNKKEKQRNSKDEHSKRNINSLKHDNHKEKYQEGSNPFALIERELDDSDTSNCVNDEKRNTLGLEQVSKTAKFKTIMDNHHSKRSQEGDSHLMTYSANNSLPSNNYDKKKNKENKKKRMINPKSTTIQSQSIRDDSNISIPSSSLDRIRNNNSTSSTPKEKNKRQRTPWLLPRPFTQLSPPFTNTTTTITTTAATSTTPESKTRQLTIASKLTASIKKSSFLFSDTKKQHKHNTNTSNNNDSQQLQQHRKRIHDTSHADNNNHDCSSLCLDSTSSTEKKKAKYSNPHSTCRSTNKSLFTELLDPSSSSPKKSVYNHENRIESSQKWARWTDDSCNDEHDNNVYGPSFLTNKSGSIQRPLNMRLSNNDEKLMDQDTMNIKDDCNVINSPTISPNRRNFSNKTLNSSIHSNNGEEYNYSSNGMNSLSPQPRRLQLEYQQSPKASATFTSPRRSKNTNDHGTLMKMLSDLRHDSSPSSCDNRDHTFINVTIVGDMQMCTSIPHQVVVLGYIHSAGRSNNNEGNECSNSSWFSAGSVKIEGSRGSKDGLKIKRRVERLRTMTESTRITIDDRNPNEKGDENKNGDEMNHYNKNNNTEIRSDKSPQNAKDHEIPYCEIAASAIIQHPLPSYAWIYFCQETIRKYDIQKDIDIRLLSSLLIPNPRDDEQIPTVICTKLCEKYPKGHFQQTEVAVHANNNDKRVIII